jgi:hypothetical protein
VLGVEAHERALDVNTLDVRALGDRPGRVDVLDSALPSGRHDDPRDASPRDCSP